MEVDSMSLITVYKFEKLPNPWEVRKLTNGKKNENSWITSFVSKYNRNEVVIYYWFYEDVENDIRKIFDENESLEVVSYLRLNGKTKLLKRVYCYINLMTKTLEVYTGSETKLNEITTALENLLKIKFTQVVLTSDNLQKIYSQHSTELKQVMFKNIDGLFYEILRGNHLENNEKYKQYMENFSECLRVISFRPKIKFLNGNSKYQVTLNGDKGTLRFSSSNGEFHWRPRVEIRQLTFLIAATLGLLS